MTRTRNPSPLLALLSIVLGLATASTTQAALGADVSVDVAGTFIAGKIEQAVTSYMGQVPLELGWTDTGERVQLSAANETSLHVYLALVFRTSLGGQPLSVPIAVGFDLPLRCDSNGPHVSLERLVILSLVPVPSEVKAQLETSARNLLVAQTQAIIQPVWNALADLPEIAAARQVCPHVEINQFGDIHAELDFEHGCINGSQRHRACGARYTGDGEHYECRNGYWVRLYRDCEPLPPPGGHPF